MTTLDAIKYYREGLDKVSEQIIKALEKIGKQDEPYPVELQEATRGNYVERMLIKRREYILEQLEETFLTKAEGFALLDELAEVETKIAQL